MRKTLNYWLRRSQGTAFRRWAEVTFKLREIELTNELDLQERRRRELQKQRETEEKAHADE